MWIEQYRDGKHECVYRHCTCVYTNKAYGEEVWVPSDRGMRMRESVCVCARASSLTHTSLNFLSHTPHSYALSHTVYAPSYTSLIYIYTIYIYIYIICIYIWHGAQGISLSLSLPKKRKNIRLVQIFIVCLLGYVYTTLLACITFYYIDTHLREDFGI